MKAVYQYRYGAPDQLRLEETNLPTPKKNEVRVEIRAVSLNGSDFEFLAGHPGYVRFWGPLGPPKRILGSDIAGVVDAVGPACKRFKPGDRIFGDIIDTKGGLAEYVCAPETALVPLPKDISFEDAAAIPQAGTVALQGIRDQGRLKHGEKILINGAGGGAGTFAVQLALNLNAEVTVVDIGKKLTALKKMGAHHTIDFQQHDYTRAKKTYDLILDFTCYRSVFDSRSALSPNGRYVLVGGALTRIFQMVVFGKMVHPFSSQQMSLLLHRQNETDLQQMLELHRTQKASPVISNIFSLEQTPAAFQSMLNGNVGKVVIKP